MSAFAAPTTSGRFTQVGVLALTVAVFAGVVATVTLQLRSGLREQILLREADTLAAVASMQLDNRVAEYGEVALEVPGALLVAVLKTSKFRGVIGVRVFDSSGSLNSSDGILGELEPPAAQDWRRVAAGEALARWHPRPPRDDVFVLPVGSQATGLVEAWVPLHRPGAKASIGAAQFWLQGGAVQAELAVHDRRLWMQAMIAWGAGSLVIVTALGSMLRRLDDANRELRNRSEDLQRANRELILAAKTSALGAVTAHLVHELKNPIAGLELLMASQNDANEGSRSEKGSELVAASELTRRLRTMVNDVVGVLRDEQTGADFELTCADIVEVVVSKVQSDALTRRVAIDALGSVTVVISGRRANLVTLVLRNLLQNALEATPEGGKVRLRADLDADGRVEFCVEDGGTGLPETVRDRLFQPCTSTKSGGSGLGLALSYQLAQQAGGRLELVRSDAQGTSFRLVLEADA